MGKRGHGEGTFRQRPDGTWEVRVSLPDGKRKSYYGKTRGDVAAKLTAARRDLDAGIDLGTKRQTVTQFLDHWLNDVVKPSKAPKTFTGYRNVVTLYIAPEIGRHQLGTLTPQHVAAMLKVHRDGGRSPRTLHHIRAVLRNALNQAVRWGLIARNVAALVEPPRQDDLEVRPMTATEAKTVIAASESDRLGVLFRLALTLGLRQGEVLGLRWEDIDLEGGKLRVRHALQRIDGMLTLKAPKTEKSKRTLHLPPSLIAVLRAHRDRQTFERTAAASEWKETGLVFATRTGTPIDPRNVLRSWHRVLAAEGMERRSFHVARHTAASMLLAEGLSLKMIQEVLGHTLLSTTADIYSHLAPEAFQEAADAMERALA